MSHDNNVKRIEGKAKYYEAFALKRDIRQEINDQRQEKQQKKK